VVKSEGVAVLGLTTPAGSDCLTTHQSHDGHCLGALILSWHVRGRLFNSAADIDRLMEAVRDFRAR